MSETNRSIRSDTGPFTIVPEWVLYSDASDRAVRLYGVLARHADKGGRSHPSRRRLAALLSCSVKTIDRAIDELERIGALAVEARFDDAGDRTSNGYVVRRVIPGGVEYDATSSDTDDATGGVTDDAVNESQLEREPVEREEDAAVPAARVYDPLKGEQIDGRNLPWDALVQATQADERTEGGLIGHALKTIRRVVVDDHSEQAFLEARTGEVLIATQIRARARLYRERWPTVELTPTALAKNWSRVVTAQPGRDLDSALEAAQRGIDDATRRTA